MLKVVGVGYMCSIGVSFGVRWLGWGCGIVFRGYKCCKCGCMGCWGYVLYLDVYRWGVLGWGIGYGGVYILDYFLGFCVVSYGCVVWDWYESFCCKNVVRGYCIV